MKCVFCENDRTYQFPVKEKNYWRCRMCGGVWMDPVCYLSPEGQKERYEQHHNSLEDDGYKAFLERFAIPVLKEACDFFHSNGQEIMRILDYGSGPEPCLVSLLRGYAGEGVRIPEACVIRGWDPFFAPDTPFFEDGADLVTCLEVAEHFEKPLEDMSLLASCIRKGGLAAIGTMTCPDEQSDEHALFDRWWYRSDETHVAFYTEKALTECAGRAGLSLVKSLSDRVFLFTRP